MNALYMNDLTDNFDITLSNTRTFKLLYLQIPRSIQLLFFQIYFEYVNYTCTFRINLKLINAAVKFVSAAQ